MRVWQIEIIIVALLLVSINVVFNKINTINILAIIAVLASFGHLQISSILLEKQTLISHTKYNFSLWMHLCLIVKDICWFLYFALSHGYAALAGVCIFFI